MIARLHEIGVRVPFAFAAARTTTTPTTSSPRSTRAASACPIATTTSSRSARFEEAREKYLAHVAAIFRLAGESEAGAKSAAATVMRMETELAKASLDNVALRDPKATDHKTSFADLQKLTPDFDWTAYYHHARLTRDARDRGAAEDRRRQRRRAEVPRGVQPPARSPPDRRLEDLPEWHLLNSAAPSLSDAFVQENFAFNGAYLAGAKEMKPRWKRCAESADRLLGEALGKKYVEKYFPPEAKARMQELVKNLRAAMGETIEGLDWMSPETKKRALEKLSTFNPKIGYPDKWKDYSKVAIARESYWDDVVAGRQVQRRRQPRDDRQARGPRALGHDAADLRRLLQPALERDRLPRRHPAAAGLQSRRRRRRQLRRDRRRHRPRDQPRLRRPGRAVRRAGPPATTGGPPRT